VVCLFLTLSLLRTSTLWTEPASAVAEFGQTVSDLAASDLGKSVSHSLEALAKLERKAQDTESAQARADQATLLSTADEYACRLVNSVRGERHEPAARFYLMVVHRLARLKPREAPECHVFGSVYHHSAPRESVGKVWGLGTANSCPARRQ
jgi:hypothetical protein